MNQEMKGLYILTMKYGYSKGDKLKGRLILLYDYHSTHGNIDGISLYRDLLQCCRGDKC